MNYDHLKQPEPQRSGERVPDLQDSLERIARLAPLPASYLEWLENAGGAIAFARGALFRTEELSPLNDKRGYQSLEMLYGPGNSDDSILGELARYQDELPDGFVPIGETPGGNLICINEPGVVYLWDHEGSPDNSYWRVCDSLETFLERLRPDDSPIGDDDGIIESSRGWTFDGRVAVVEMIGVSFANAALIDVTFSDNGSLAHVMLPHDDSDRLIERWPARVRAALNAIQKCIEQRAWNYVAAFLAHADNQSEYIINRNVIVEELGHDMGGRVFEMLLEADLAE